MQIAAGRGSDAIVDSIYELANRISPGDVPSNREWGMVFQTDHLFPAGK
jgi:hypothetical protein